MANIKNICFAVFLLALVFMVVLLTVDIPTNKWTYRFISEDIKKRLNFEHEPGYFETIEMENDRKYRHKLLEFRLGHPPKHRPDKNRQKQQTQEGHNLVNDSQYYNHQVFYNYSDESEQQIFKNLSDFQDSNSAHNVDYFANLLKERLLLPNNAVPPKVETPCGVIDYSSNSYTSHTPCIGAICANNDISPLKQRVEDLLTSEKFRLTRNEHDAISSLAQSIPESDIIIASAASSNHYDEMQAMFRNLHNIVYPELDNFSVIVFDLGLTPSQIKMTKTNCRCNVVPFDFSLFPKHVSRLRCYSWKPLIIKALLSRARKLLIWQDTSIRWRSGFHTVLDRAKTYGLQVRVGGGDRATANTLHEMFEYMDERECQYESVTELHAGVAVFKKEEMTDNLVITPWSKCALEKNCICPYDPDTIKSCRKLRPKRCHRFDQSALTLLVGKLYSNQRYKVEMPRDTNAANILNVQRHHTAPNYFQP